ncbi:MAG: flavin reductase family protein [SAR324 cluster bacterium]|nr:flavin reductase family protein [SAR324 cluster bacterium]
MAEFESAGKDPVALYKLMIGSIVPRPIGFVATIGREGVTNLAPFSFFNGVTFNPPTVLFAAIDRQGERKDTARNVEEVPEFVVHIVSEDIAERMNVTCGDYGAHISEFVEAGLTAIPGTRVRVPRVAEAKVAMECRVTHHLRIGTAPAATSLVIGEVIYWHIDDGVLTESGRVDADKLQAVGRMGGVEYARTLDRFAMDRPVIPDDDPRSVAAYRTGAKPPMPLPK